MCYLLTCNTYPVPTERIFARESACAAIIVVQVTILAWAFPPLLVAPWEGLTRCSTFVPMQVETLGMAPSQAGRCTCAALAAIARKPDPCDDASIAGSLMFSRLSNGCALGTRCQLSPTADVPSHMPGATSLLLHRQRESSERTQFAIVLAQSSWS
jgi:hypothetical protein